MPSNRKLKLPTLPVNSVTATTIGSSPILSKWPKKRKLNVLNESIAKFCLALQRIALRKHITLIRCTLSCCRNGTVTVVIRNALTNAFTLDTCHL